MFSIVNMSFYISNYDSFYNSTAYWNQMPVLLWFVQFEAKDSVNIKVANETLCWRI